MAEVVLAPEAKSSRVKVVAGEVALDGSNPTAVSVAGKLSTVVSVQATIAANATPGDVISIVTYEISGTTVNFYAWVHTATDPTLVASTATHTISYQIFGY